MADLAVPAGKEKNNGFWTQLWRFVRRRCWRVRTQVIESGFITKRAARDLGIKVDNNDEQTRQAAARTDVFSCPLTELVRLPMEFHYKNAESLMSVDVFRGKDRVGTVVLFFTREGQIKSMAVAK